MARRRRHKHASGVPHLIRQRGANKFWYGWLAGREVCLRTDDAQLAHQRLIELAAAPPERSGVAGEPGVAQARVELLSELAALYIDHIKPPRHTPRTAKKYQAAVVRLVEWAEKSNVRHCEKVNPSLLASYVRAIIKRGASSVVINRELSAIHSLFRFAVAEDHMAVDPLEGAALKRLRLREPRPKPNATIISQSQVDTFLKMAESNAHSAHAALFKATAGCGARIDEMRHLDLSDIDESRGYLTITPKAGWTTKSYRYRSVPVSATTIAALKTFIATRHLAPLDDSAIWKVIQKLRIEAGLTLRFSMHDLRRSWASAVHAKGASLKQISVWLGHSGVQVTERYIRITDDGGGHEFLPR